MNEYSSFIGLDVHARSITAKACVKETGEVKTKAFGNCPTASELAEWILQLPTPIYCAYESGCTGYVLCRELRAMGIDCDVIAVTTLAKSNKQKRHKTDKMDAAAILSAIMNPASEHSVVWVPSDEAESARDLARLADDTVDALKRSKQQLRSFLLRHGYVWNQKTAGGKLKKRWGSDFWRWLRSIRFDDEVLQKTLDFYIRAVEEHESLAESVKREVRSESQSVRWKPYVDAIMALKGVDFLAAYLAAAEFDNFERFRSGRKVSAWLGVTPRENSSGERECRGGITKDGNSHLRRALVEGNTAISLRRRSQKRLAGDQVVPDHIRRMANRANDRLLERYRHLTEDLKKNPCKARIAVVSEQIRWIWAIGLEVQRSMASST